MKRSKFSLSHYKLLTMNMGHLVPLTWYEGLPGDTLQQSTSALIRVSPLLAPVMHPVRVRIHHFFVPNRLIWEEWEDFITGGKTGDFTAEIPRVTATNVTQGSLLDYLGVPPKDYSSLPNGNISMSALPLRAYTQIYNDHYRDQDLIDELPLSMASGVDTTTNTDLQRVAWEKDYFTTTRPWEQKGTEVTIPLQGTVPVRGIAKQAGGGFNSPPGDFKESGGFTTYYEYNTTINPSQELDAFRVQSLDQGFPNIYADMEAGNTGISVNDLRLALAIQRYQEARAQYGSRYVEYLRYLGVRPADARLQNAEYLGGGRNVIQFSEVLRTGSSDDVTQPIGDLKGHGIAAVRSNRYRRFIPEHGIVMSLMSVIPKAIYTQGLCKMWNRDTKEAYFQKELQHLGDQRVLNREIMANHSQPDETFGYQSRYDEYRYLPSMVAGEFHDTLNYWHYGREFASDVALNKTFVEANPTKRTYASQDTDCLYVMANHSIQTRRMLIKNATPRTF